MKTRILRRGEKYVVQKKVLFWWEDITTIEPHKYNINTNSNPRNFIDQVWYYIEFDSYNDAEHAMLTYRIRNTSEVEVVVNE